MQLERCRLGGIQCPPPGAYRYQTCPAISFGSGIPGCRQHLTLAITSTMDTCVPYSKPCPHSKRWWTKRLSKLRDRVKDLSKLAYQMCGIPLHPSHNDLKAAKDQYANEINATKKQDWQDWLEDIEGNDLWTANKYILSEPCDGGKTRVPSLITTNPDGSKSEAFTNCEKSEILAKSFFPPPPVADSIPPDAEYPDPVAHLPPHYNGTDHTGH